MIEKKGKKEKILVLLGGESSEREVSLKSGKAVVDAINSLSDKEAIPFDPAERSLTEILTIAPNKVFNCLHGGIGENGVIQGFLEATGILFTGSKHLACGLSMQKHLCKSIWQNAGLKVINGHIITKLSAENVKLDLTLPIAIKPSNGGSSVGVSKVEKTEDIKPAIEKALKYDDIVVAEEWITGEEYTIGIIPDIDGKLITLPSIRITPQTPSGWYDYEAKYQTAGTDMATSYELDTLNPEDEKKARELANSAFLAIQAEGWGRIDLIKRGSEFFILEANLSPGMTATSLVPKASNHIGIPFEKLVEQILNATKN